LPHAKHGLRLDLRTLILVLCALTAVVMLCASYFASYRVQRQLLIDHALEANRVYAAKLASITDAFIGSALQQLAFSASEQGRQLDDPAALQRETDRVLGQSMAFNSTFVIDANGVLLAISPAPLRHMVGTRMQSPGVQEALQERRALVSTPYLSAANNLVVALTQPVVDANGRYLGYVGGSLYLRERNILNRLLGEHFYKDGSYLYVVDRNRRLLYHPDSQRVGTVVQGNELIDQLTNLGNGTRQLTNSQGVEMVAGFATVPSAGCRVRGGLRLAPPGRYRVRRPRRSAGAQAHPLADHLADGRLHHPDRPAADLRQHRPGRAGIADLGALPAGVFCRWRIRRGLRLPDGTRAQRQAGFLRQLRTGFDLFRVRLCGGDRL